MPGDDEEFEHEVRLTLGDLDIEPFRETQQVWNFDCGNRDLNDFLTTTQVRKYEQENFGRTYLVFRAGELAAYFTVSFGSLRVDYLKTYKSFSRDPEVRLEAIPALTIGRLAVDLKSQRQGIGRLLVRHIAGMALEMQGRFGVRLVILHSKPESVAFYQKCGFELVVTPKEKKRINRTMFFDLRQVDDVA